MKYFAISEESINKLLLLAKSLYFADQNLFPGSSETTREYCFKIREIVESLKQIELPENMKE